MLCGCYHGMIVDWVVEGLMMLCCRLGFVCIVLLTSSFALLCPLLGKAAAVRYSQS